VERMPFQPSRHETLHPPG